MGLINGIMTLVALVTFIAIVFWAFSKGRKKANKDASMLPFEQPDEEDVVRDKEASSDKPDKRGSHD